MRRARALALALTLVGCRIGAELPATTLISCEGGEECPEGFICVEGKRCAAVDGPCVEASGGGHEAVRDGLPCDRDDGADGVCVLGTCARSRCGDGFADRLRGEECDDGNLANDDACLSLCIEARCGDHIVQRDVEDCEGPLANGACNACVARCEEGFGNCNGDWGDGCECEPGWLGDTTAVTRAMAQDDEAVYVAAYDGPYDPGEEPGEIVRFAKADGARLVLVAGRGEPIAIGVDATYVYWLDRELLEVARCPKLGGEVELVAAGRVDVGFVLAVDGGFVYWAESASLDGEIMRRPTDLSTPEEQVSSAHGFIVEEMTGGHDGYLYWTLQSQGEVWQLTPAGDDFIIDDAQDGPASLLTAPGRLYWTNVGSGDIDDPALDGAVLRLDSGAASRKVMVDDLVEPRHLALAGDWLYYGDVVHADVWRLPATGSGTPVPIGVFANVDGLAADEERVYVLDGAGVQFIARTW